MIFWKNNLDRFHEWENDQSYPLIRNRDEKFLIKITATDMFKSMYFIIQWWANENVEYFCRLSIDENKIFEIVHPKSTNSRIPREIFNRVVNELYKITDWTEVINYLNWAKDELSPPDISEIKLPLYDYDSLMIESVLL